MDIALIYGEPASGKTTIVKGMLNDEFAFFEKPFAHYYNPKTNVCILGNYHADTIFLGTDKLSMSIQPTVIDFINKGNRLTKYIIEGDRLFNGKFIDAVKPKVIIISATKEEVLARRVSRGSDQDPTFLKAKTTKIKNVTDNYAHYIIDNNDGANLDLIRHEIISLLENRSSRKLINPVIQQNSLF